MDFDDGSNNKQKKKSALFYWLIALVIFVILNWAVFPALLRTPEREVSYNTFLELVEKHQVEKVTVGTAEIEFTSNASEYEGVILKTGRMEDPDLLQRLEDSGAEFTAEIPQQTSMLEYFLLSYLLPIVIFVVLWIVISRRVLPKMQDNVNQMTFGMGGAKSNARVYVKSSNTIRFSDVAGEEEAKDLLKEIVDFLHNPAKYKEIGAKMPKGALLVGPPGTGKTLLAKAVAGEADVPFFSISGSEFVEMFVGMGAAKVRDLFKQAEEKAPCIVFIDEIDAIGKKRDGSGLAGNDEREQTLNQLLAEMDGFDGSKGVVILAATNRPESLDPALLRPGRFDRRIPVELPDIKGREDILKVHAKDIKIADNVDFSEIARMTAGCSGAELANIINEAALRAVRDGRKFASQNDLVESVEVVIAGYQKKTRVLSNKEKLIVSYHECGHAMVAAMQTQSAPVQKITIIPRTSGALGYTMQVDEGEHYLMSRTEMENRIATLCGGRAAEDLIFGEITTGASNDIEQATKMARAMIAQYGMSSEFGMVALQTQTNMYLGGDTSLACSPETQAKIDQLVVSLVEREYKKARQILVDHKDKLHEVAKYLYEHETITGEEFMMILNQKKRLTVDSQPAESENPAAGTSDSAASDSSNTAAGASGTAASVGSTTASSASSTASPDGSVPSGGDSKGTAAGPAKKDDTAQGTARS